MDERKSSKLGSTRTLNFTFRFAVVVVAVVVVNATNGHDFEIEIEQMRKNGANKYDISILYEEKTEFLHSRITLRPLALGFHNFEKMFHEYGQKNLSLLGKVLHSRLEHKHSRLKNRAEYLLSASQVDTRSKRAIEFIGNLISKAFGNPGPEDWKKNNANILAMKYAISRQRDNSILLHNNIDSNQHEIEKHNVLLKRIFMDLLNVRNQIHTESDGLMDVQNYVELEILLDSLQELETSIADIVNDGKMGLCNIKGMNKDFLIGNLRQFESNRMGFAPVFASWEWESYYKYELCSVARNREELWVTMRIPIVRHGELMARILPTPSFGWIKDLTNELGIEMSFFKEIEHEEFSVITRSNYEMCSVFGSTRVCNIRKTKFRNNAIFVVPIEIDKNRIVALSNVTGNTTIHVEADCKDQLESIEISQMTFLKIPPNCSMKTKAFEISKMAKHEFVTEEMEFELVDKLEYKKLSRSNYLNEKKTMNSIPEKSHFSIKTEFDRNNNLTTEALQKIITNHEGMSDSLNFVKVGGITSTVSIFALLAIPIAILLIKKCKKGGENSKININMDLSHEMDSRANQDASVSNNLPVSHEIEIENASNDLNRSLINDDSREKINKQLVKKA
jgi:hypothetical protein